MTTQKNLRSRNILFYAFLLFCMFNTEISIAQDRQHEPVILSGSEIESQFGTYLPSQVHAYSYSSDSGWVHIPFQIDERKITDMETPYGPDTCGANGGGVYLDTLYCDLNTHVGADVNLNIDMLDELVFMYKDADEKVNFSLVNDPTEVINAGLLKRCEVELEDPISSTKTYTYLYAVSNPSSLSATDDYVEYQIHVPAPSDCDYQIDSSKIITDNYQYGYLSAWETVFLTIGDTWNGDLLDRRHVMIYPQDPGYCPKTDFTFSDKWNAYEVNRDGTVRAIRSVMGTHSGYRNVRVEWFYETKHVSLNKHRVHAQEHTDPTTGLTSYGGVQDVFDFSTDFPDGVSYYHNNLSDNMDGIAPALTTLNPITSQRIISNSIDDIQLNFLYELDTDMSPSEYQAYNSYEDLGPATTYRCHGDIQSFGNTGTGLLFNQLTSTDPAIAFPILRKLRLYRFNYYLTHNMDILADLEIIRDNPVSWSLSCEILHCTNGVQDADEEGIDCGGLDCIECDHCTNGIQDVDETGVDCGGMDCDPCNTCNLSSVDFEDFQVSMGDWTPGSSATRFFANIPLGNYVARIDGNGTGAYIEYQFTQDYDEVRLNFDYQTGWYTNDLKLEVNTGAAWLPLQDFAPSNNAVTNATSMIFSVQNGHRIRFKGNQSFPAYAVLDNILIEGCNYASSLILNTSEMTIENSFDVFPNPSDGHIHIRPAVTGWYTVTVFDSSGKEVKRAHTNDDITFFIADPGIYFVRIWHTSGGSYSSKLIISR